MFIECDCSVDCDEHMAAWDAGWEVADSRPAIWCYECGRWIKPGETYWAASGIHPDNFEDWEKYLEDDETTEADEESREYFNTCLGCKRIADRFCSGGYYLGCLSEAVAECIGFDYTADPEEIEDEEDAAA